MFDRSKRHDELCVEWRADTADFRRGNSARIKDWPTGDQKTGKWRADSADLRRDERLKDWRPTDQSPQDQRAGN